jgi:hypothetical protein
MHAKFGLKATMEETIWERHLERPTNIKITILKLKLENGERRCGLDSGGCRQEYECGGVYRLGQVPV